MERVVKKLVLTAGLLLASSALAQVPVFNVSTQPYQPITGGTVLSFPSTDDSGVVVTLPFAFPWFGANYNSVLIQTNGFISFDTTTCTSGCYSNGTIPSTGAPNNAIYGWWDDLYVSGGTVSYTASASEFVVQYSNVEDLGGSFVVNMQIKLSPAGTVTIHHGPFTGSAADATVGFENVGGTLGANILATSGNTCTSQSQAGCCQGNCNVSDTANGKMWLIGEPNEADLGLTSVTLSNLVVQGNNNLTFDVQGTIRNFGRTAANNFIWRAYLSTDRLLDGSDQLVATGAALSVGPTSSANVNASAATSTPPAPGAYYVLIQADSTNVVTEASETNNVGSTADVFVSGLDLVAASISGVPSSGGGNVDPVQINFYNRGTSAPGLVTYRILLSADAVLDVNDFPIHTATRMVSGGETVNESVNVTMPANVPNGTFRYLLQVDPANALTEASETNNVVASSGMVNVTRADLVAEFADFVDPITSISTRNAKFGEPARLVARISNQGGANATNFRVAMVVSPDSTLSLLSDALVCEQVVPALNSGGMPLNVTLDCPLPLNDPQAAPYTSGQYFVFLVTDSSGAIYELNKGNNNLSIGPIRITAPGADLTVTNVTAPASSGVGEIIPVVRSIRNIGNVDAPAVAYRFYASANDIITPDDIPLKIIDQSNGMARDEGMVTLARGVSSGATELVRLPGTMPAGTYYVGCIVDPANTIAELDKSNNGLASRTMQVAPSSLRVVNTLLPDATVGRPFSFDLAAVGEQGTSRWTVDESQGAKPTWLTLGETDGLMTGTPMTQEVVAFTVVLENNGRQVAARLVLRVLPPTVQVDITTAGLPAIVNSSSIPFQFTLGAAGGVRPYSWRIAGGALPSGLALSTDGVISGAPRGTPNGTTRVTVEVRDATGGRAQKELSLRLVAPGAIVFRTVALPDALMGQDYLQDVAVGNLDGTALAKPLKWTIVGNLPDGLSLTEQTELVTVVGKPSRAGTFAFTLSVEDANGRSDTTDFLLNVFPPRYKVNGTMPTVVRPGESVNVALNVSPSSSVTYAVVSGALPPGLALGVDGVLSGDVAGEGAEGVWSFVVEAHDQVGASGLAPFSLRVEREARKEGCSATGGGLSPLALLAVGFLALRRRFTLRLPRWAGLVGAVVALAPLSSYAQTYQVVGPTPITFQALGTGGLPLGSTIAAGATITLPFDLPFYGSQVNTMSLSAYGYLAVGGSTASDSSNETVPHSVNVTSSARAFIAPWWDSLTTSSVTYRFAVAGSAPNRVAIVEWNNSGSTTARITFQALMYETTGQIRFAYSSALPGTSSASVGVQGDLGNGVPGLTCSGTGLCSSIEYPASQALDFFLPPDLEIAAMSVPQAGYAGVSFPVTASVRNRGGRAATAVDVTFYLSADAQLDTGDTVIGTSTAQTINAGETVQITSTAALPAGLMPGNFFVIAAADPGNTVTEQRENNNVSPPVAMAIGMPTADLVVSAFTAPTTAQPGAMLQLSRTFQNVGNATSTGFKYSYFLSDNAVVSVSDRALSPVGNVTSGLMPAQTDMAMDSVALPAGLPAGNYWLGVCVNYDSGTSAFGGNEITIVNNCVTSTAAVQVTTTELTITTATLPMTTQYAPFGVRLEASGGNGTYAWELASGTLPAGVTLSPFGDLAGAPARTGSFSFEVRVASGTLTQTKALSLSVMQGGIPLVIVDQSLPAAEFGRAYVTPLVAVGGKPPYQWSVKEDSKLPAGLALASDGLVEGRATQSGDFTFPVEVTDAAGTRASKELTVRVVNPTSLSIATTALSEGTINREYLQPLVAVGGRAPYTWSLVRYQQLAENPTEAPTAAVESNPPGMPVAFPENFGLVIEDGVQQDFLRGAPKLAGLFVLTLKVIDGAGTEDTATVLLHVSYREGLAITTTMLPDAFINQQYAVKLSHNGGREAQGVVFSLPCVKQAVRPNDFVCTGVDQNQTLPAGLVLGADGSIIGTATAAEGTYTFLVKVSDVNGRQDVRGLSIRVRPDFTQEKTGCSATGLEPSLFLLLGVAGLLRRRRVQR